MRALSWFPLLLSLATACTIPGTGEDGADDEDDDGDGGDTTGNTDDGTEWEPCVENWVDYVGPDDPVVGDEWTVWLYCDGALLTGPMVIRFDPLDFATVDENVVTWVMSGEATMRVQTGAEWAEMLVTVGE